MTATPPASAPPPPDPLESVIHAEGRRSDAVAFERAVVGLFLQAADMLGVPKSVAVIYGMCFASAEPLSFADIEHRLNISKGSISQGVRVLREVGALKEVSGAADRREMFTPDLELRKLASHWLEERLQKQLNSGRTSLKNIAKLAPASQQDSDRVLRARVKALQAWYEKTQAVLPLVKTFLKLT